MLRSIVRRWRTVRGTEGCWTGRIVVWVGSIWSARYRNERSTWRNPTVRHIAAQGNVSGFFGHFDGDDKDMENMGKDVKEKRK